MNIVVINGTEVKGCTYHIKEAFLEPMRNISEITEFYLPRDMSQHCYGCKFCFFHTEAHCPHTAQISPIWNAMLKSDLIVLTAPIYGLGIPSSLKALLDHLCVHWMGHRPEPVMFSKSAVVITNCIGPSFMAKSSQRDAVNALSWLGISKIHRLGIGLLEGVIWNELPSSRREKIVGKAKLFGMKLKNTRPARKSPKTQLKFLMCKLLHQKLLNNEDIISADNRYWLERGWIKKRDQKIK